jgi:hypothetical protein
MTKKDVEAAEAAKCVLYQFAQYTYTLSVGDCLKIVRAVDRVRRRQEKERLNDAA